MGTLRLYTKQALSISEQIELLKSRDLNIADSSKAAKFLGEVSYFRFVQYLRPMEADKVTVLRNCCAHHSRLWNRYLSNAPQMNASLRGAWVNIDGVDANKVYAIACCIAYWLDSMGYGLNFKNELKSLLVSYPQVDPAAMGFPENWISEPLWR